MRLRVATFNLENLDDEDDRRPRLADRLAALRPLLARLRADVLCLQEVNAQRPDRHGPRLLRALDRLLDETPYAAYHRAASQSERAHLLDVHNLVTLSRWPITAVAQHRHDHVPAAPWQLLAGGDPASPNPATLQVGFDRPVVEAAIALPDGRVLHVLNAHLRAPLAAPIPGQKLEPHVWRSTAGWAEGFFLAGWKRIAQALELRLVVDAHLDRAPDALVLVAGDFNADLAETPLRIVRADVDDTGNPALARRSLVPLEARAPAPRRYSVIHRGRPILLDHLLASAALAAAHRATEIHNEELADEVLAPEAGIEAPLGFHAAVVAELDLAPPPAPAPPDAAEP